MSLSTSLKRFAAPASKQTGSGETDRKRPDGGGGSLVSARAIELTGQWGQVFGPLDLDIDRGGLSLISAPPGAARTAFLMALCGRMKLKSGRLTVLGHTNEPHMVFKESAIACFDELDGAQPSVTVQDLITEQKRWESNFFKWVPLATTEDLKEMCGYLFEGLPLPPIDAFITDLNELEQRLLRIGVANTRRPPLLVVGELDRMADADQQDELLERLISLGEHQSVLAAHVNGEDYDDRVGAVVEVPGLLEFAQRQLTARKIADGAGRDGSADRADDRHDGDDRHDRDDGGDDADTEGADRSPEPGAKGEK